MYRILAEAAPADGARSVARPLPALVHGAAGAEPGPAVPRAARGAGLPALRLLRDRGRRQPPAGARCLPGPRSVGVALDGVEVRVLDERGAPLPAGQEGEIAIRSAAVARGYVTAEPPGAAGAFVPGEDGITEYRTGDIGVIDADGFIFWRGRRDQVINVGGLKVYPSEVVQVLERCPDVSGARVFAARDRSGEEVVHAVVTLSQSTREQDILAFCRQHLADYKVPRRIEITESITTPEAEKMSNLSGDIS